MGDRCVMLARIKSSDKDKRNGLTIGVSTSSHSIESPEIPAVFDYSLISVPNVPQSRFLDPWRGVVSRLPASCDVPLDIL